MFVSLNSRLESNNEQEEKGVLYLDKGVEEMRSDTAVEQIWHM
jgi:hypothetical protein